MFHLPRTIPADIRLLLEKQLSDEISTEEMLTRIAQVIVRLFNARELLLIIRQEAKAGSNPHLSQRLVTRSEVFSEHPLIDRWLEKKIDQGVRLDVERRMSCVSFSAFSWPYPTLPASEGVSSVPAEYTLLLPINSHLGIGHSEDPFFSGYFAILFDAFPVLTDSMVQLITLLPELLSGITAAHYRQRARGSILTFAHEIKRGLLFAEDRLQLLASQVPEEFETGMHMLEECLRRLLHQTSSLLIMDRLENDNLRLSSMPMNINDAVQDAANIFQPHCQRSNVELRIELADNLPLSPIDPALFPTAIENLLDNSLKYSKPGCCIYLRTKKVDADHVRLEVEDNGSGLGSDELLKIFEKHYRTTPNTVVTGNGLGLYLVRKIVEAHQGQVYSQSDDKLKTCFVIDLPTVKEK